MHIDKLEIKGFGKINSRILVFGKGINIIYGSNEAGKTTLQWFIRSMLYGLKNSRQSGTGFMQSLKRYEPWMGGQYGGAMTYTLDNGSQYRVERDFSNGSVAVFDRNYNNIIGSFNIGRDKLPMLALKHLGMDEQTFERTVLIRQLEMRLDESNTSALASCLANASTTGFEDISIAKAEKALFDALKSNIGTGRTKSQPLDKLEARLKQLESEYADTRERREKTSSTRDELSKLRSFKAGMEAKKNYLEQVGRLIRIRKELDINLKRESELKRTAREIKERRMLLSAYASTDRYSDSKNPDDNSNKKFIKMSILCLAAMLIFLLLLVYIILEDVSVNLWPFTAACCLGTASAGIAGILALRKGNNSRVCKDTRNVQITGGNAASLYAEDASDGLSADEAVISEELKNVMNRLDELSRSLEEGISNVAALGKSFDDSIYSTTATGTSIEEEVPNATVAETSCEDGISSASATGSKYKDYFAADELEAEFYDLSIEELEKAWQYEMENAHKSFNNAALKEKYLEGILNNCDDDSDQLQRLEEETIAVKEKISYLKYKGNSLRLAMEVLQEAGLEIKNTYTPDLDSRLTAIVSSLTGGRYNDLRGDDRLSMRVAVPENGDIKSIGSLSGAIEDQMYLALRLAMADLLTAGGESLPIIMDEAFSQFDDRRTRLTLEYLSRTYKYRQILIFTCKSREIEIAREICGDDMNFVEL